MVMSVVGSAAWAAAGAAAVVATARASNRRDMTGGASGAGEAPILGPVDVSCPRAMAAVHVASTLGAGPDGVADGLRQRYRFARGRVHPHHHHAAIAVQAAGVFRIDDAVADGERTLAHALAKQFDHDVG